MLIENAEQTDRQTRLKHKLHQHLSTGDYRRRFLECLNEDRAPRIEVSLDRLRVEDPELADACIESPLELTALSEDVLDTLLKELAQTENFADLSRRIRVSFEGNLGRNTVTPRGLKARLVNKLVKIQGIVISASKVRPRLLESTHFCEKTKSFLTYQYSDPLSLRMRDPGAENLKEAVPAYDNDNNPLFLEFGLCEYKDVQVLMVQEMPENVPTGLLSRSVEVLLQEDLVDRAKPGDRVQVIGVLRPVKTSSTLSIGIFRTTLMATSVSAATAVGETSLTPQEVKDINTIAKREDLLPLFIRSLAPSIAGNDGIKEALLLLLLGGVEKILENGTRLRGDVNVLLVGDPSTGKSQFLRRIMNLANLAFSTTGRGSSGVGLTAAVTTDRDTNERQLEAGAMVLADRGVICVDEFDKMSVEDRVAMHEVMEQQTVTIAKAGIHVSLNARCSVLAAANPLYGEYIKSRSASNNINLPDSLLSRFDLIFITLDEKDPEHDRVVAHRVTNNHRFQGTNLLLQSLADGSGAIELAPLEATGTSVRPFEQYNPLLHESKQVNYLTQPFMKKYIAFARKKQPRLTDLSSRFISAKWAQLRDIDHSEDFRERNRILPVTIRTLESLIRLSTAYAKLRLATEVGVHDCVHAFRVFLNGFYGGEDKFDPSFFRDLESEYGIRPVSREPVPEKRGFRRVAPSQTTPSRPTPSNAMEIEANPPSSADRPETDGRDPGSDRKRSRVAPEAQAPARALDQLSKDLFNITLAFQEDKKRKFKTNTVEVPELWEHVQATFPNAKFPAARFKSRQQFDKVLERLIVNSKLVLENDRIYII